MIIWLNGAFGSGKTTAAFELNKRLSKSFVYDPENLGSFIRHNIPKNLHKDNYYFVCSTLASPQFDSLCW